MTFSSCNVTLILRQTIHAYIKFRSHPDTLLDHRTLIQLLVSSTFACLSASDQVLNSPAYSHGSVAPVTKFHRINDFIPDLIFYHV